jgi:hypothetical protein
MAVTEKRKMLRTITPTLPEPVNVSDLLSNIKKMKNQEIKKPKKVVDEDLRENEPLEYEIMDDDDDMVRMVKDEINSKGITTTDVYNVSSTPNAGYNLIYGLRKRPTMAYKTFQKWAEILDMEVVVTLKEKNA